LNGAFAALQQPLVMFNTPALIDADGNLTCEWENRLVTATTFPMHTVSQIADDCIPAGCGRQLTLAIACRALFDHLMSEQTVILLVGGASLPFPVYV